ncbi:hypothetical protein Tco_1162637 [Tanacetum coccineum]
MFVASSRIRLPELQSLLVQVKTSHYENAGLDCTRWLWLAPLSPNLGILSKWGAIIWTSEFSTMKLERKSTVDKDTYSASAEDIEVQSCFMEDQLTNSSPPMNCMPPDVLLREIREQPVVIAI